MVEAAGLEPAIPHEAAVLKTAVYANSTTPPGAHHGPFLHAQEKLVRNGSSGFGSVAGELGRRSYCSCHFEFPSGLAVYAKPNCFTSRFLHIRDIFLHLWGFPSTYFHIDERELAYYLSSGYAGDTAMDKRNRSPNYPALSLPDAIERVGTLYKNIHTHAAPREVIAKGLGYKSISGPAATAISTLAKYGLIERAGEELKVSDRSLRIIHPHSDLERVKAIKEAASEPELFAELFERFSGTIPNDELLRNVLARKSFVPSAVSTVILSFRETLEFANRESLAYDRGTNQFWRMFLCRLPP